MLSKIVPEDRYSTMPGSKPKEAHDNGAYLNDNMQKGAEGKVAGMGWVC